MKIINYLVIALLLISITAYAQNEEKTAVKVIHNGDDVVGNRLAYAIKEAIRKSYSMRISEEKEKKIVVLIATLPSNPDYPAISTTYSVTWCISIPETQSLYYQNGITGYCGSNQVDNAADGIAAKTDEQVSEFKRDAKPSE